MHTRRWGLWIFSGKAVVGNGERECELSHVLILTSSRDVAAGIAILQEAGGLITSANPPEDPETAEIGEVRLGSRLYLAIR